MIHSEKSAFHVSSCQSSGNIVGFRAMFGPFSLYVCINWNKTSIISTHNCRFTANGSPLTLPCRKDSPWISVILALDNKTGWHYKFTLKVRVICPPDWNKRTCFPLQKFHFCLTFTQRVGREYNKREVKSVSEHLTYLCLSLSDLSTFPTWLTLLF